MNAIFLRHYLQFIKAFDRNHHATFSFSQTAQNKLALNLLVNQSLIAIKFSIWILCEENFCSTFFLFLFQFVFYQALNGRLVIIKDGLQV